jgi:hypothetical protein
MAPRIDQMEPRGPGPVEQDLRKIALRDADFGANRTVR